MCSVKKAKGGAKKNVSLRSECLGKKDVLVI